MRKTRKALITGVAGQDGWYLSRLLRSKGYEVHGLVNRQPDEPAPAGDTWHRGDVTDRARMLRLLNAIRPDELYNLGARSRVRLSFDAPVATAEANARGVLNVLEAVRRHGRPVRVFQPGSSDMFGTTTRRCSEKSPFQPASPYAGAKLCAYWLTAAYREKHGLFACNGILFNHESPRRPPHYVTRKITRAAARIKLGLQEKLRLGDINIRRDWGFAGDTVEAMWLMLRRNRPDDYVVATGETHSLREFLQEAFGAVDLDWGKHVEFDPSEIRPTEVATVSGDASKARRELQWKPRVSFRELVRMMVGADLDQERRPSE